MFIEHLFDCDDILLAFVAEYLVLFYEKFDEFVDGVNFLYFDEGNIFDKHGEFLLLCEEGAVHEIVHYSDIAHCVLFVVSGYLEGVYLGGGFFEHF